MKGRILVVGVMVLAIVFGYAQPRTLEAAENARDEGRTLQSTHTRVACYLYYFDRNEDGGSSDSAYAIPVNRTITINKNDRIDFYASAYFVDVQDGNEDPVDETKFYWRLDERNTHWYQLDYDDDDDDQNKNLYISKVYGSTGTYTEDINCRVTGYDSQSKPKDTGNNWGEITVIVQ